MTYIFEGMGCAEWSSVRMDGTSGLPCRTIVDVVLTATRPRYAQKNEAPGAWNTEGPGRSCPTNSGKKMNTN